MLSANLVRVRSVKNRLVPQYLDTGAESWRDAAEQVLQVYRGKQGMAYGDIEEELEDAIGKHPAQIVCRGFAKLLEDRCEFETVSGHPPEDLRERVFLAATAQRRAASFDRTVVLQDVARALGLEFKHVEQGLFADLKSEQRFVKFDDISVTRLLERYNVALAQAILLRATQVTAEIRNETPARFRQLFRAVKFHRLICDFEQREGTVTLRLDGPLSLFTATQKYGLQLALFLPHLLQCRDFDLRADVRWGAQKKQKLFVLTAEDGLISYLADTASWNPPELQMFVELFRKKIEGWTIEDEADVLPLGRGFWAPDFRLTHKLSGKSVYLEILGFWRRRSAEQHLDRLRKYVMQPFLLAVSDQLHIEDSELKGLPAEIIRFRQMPLPEEVARHAEELIVWAN